MFPLDSAQKLTDASINLYSKLNVRVLLLAYYSHKQLSHYTILPFLVYHVLPYYINSSIITPKQHKVPPSVEATSGSVIPGAETAAPIIS